MDKDLRVLKTRRCIHNALMELLSEKPISKITITELCRKAQINRKTFYHHYDTISEIETELESEILDEFSHGFSNGSISDVKSVFSAVGSVIGERREFFRRLTRHNPDVFNNGRLKEALCRMIAAVMKNNGANADEQTLKMAADFAVSGVFALYAQWFENDEYEWDEVNAVSIKLAENALSDI